MSADKHRGIRRQKQKRAKDMKKQRRAAHAEPGGGSPGARPAPAPAA